jgi:two-component system chemotaxis response regulator CheY
MAKDGILKAKEHPDTKIIFSDYNMPGMNGLEMIGKIQSMEGHEKTFFAVLTTESSNVMKEQGRSYGVRVWIVKPIIPMNILLGTEAILKKINE